MFEAINQKLLQQTRERKNCRKKIIINRLTRSEQHQQQQHTKKGVKLDCMTCQKVLKWKIIGRKKENQEKKLHKMLQRVVHKICLIYAA